MWATGGKLATFKGSSTSWTDIANGVRTSDLDIYPGQSGSAVWQWPGPVLDTIDLNYQIRAIVNTVEDAGKAYHRTMTKSMFDIVYKW